MIIWQFYPKSDKIPGLLSKIVDIFEDKSTLIDSSRKSLVSAEVLSIVGSDLQKIGFKVECGKKENQKIHVPVLFGRSGKLEKYFEADGYHSDGKTVVEIEAGRAVTNFQFLKDLFQACMMHGVDYLCIAVRNVYRSSKDSEKVIAFFDTLYASGRLKLPLKGVLIIGY